MSLKIVKRSIAVLMASVLLFVLAGCNVDEVNHNNDYVSSVKKYVDNVVTYTREYKEYETTFNCRDVEESKKYIGTMDSLIECFQKILKLQSTDEFDEYDSSLKTLAQSALETITEIKSLTSYAVETGDDTLYKNDEDLMLENYDVLYEGLKDISAEIQTYWRNA